MEATLTPTVTDRVSVKITHALMDRANIRDIIMEATLTPTVTDRAVAKITPAKMVRASI